MLEVVANIKGPNCLKFTCGIKCIIYLAIIITNICGAALQFIFTASRFIVKK